MKVSSAKQKGRQAEHDVIAALQAWWRRLEPNAVFMRTPRSGGWSTAGATGMKTQGDLCYDPTTCSLWPFSVEVKHHKVVTVSKIENFVAGKKSRLIEKFWSQCTKAAAHDGGIPLLVLRGDKMPFRAIFDYPNSVLKVRLLDFFVTYDPSHFLKKMLDRSAPTGGIMGA